MLEIAFYLIRPFSSIECKTYMYIDCFLGPINPPASFPLHLLLSINPVTPRLLFLVAQLEGTRLQSWCSCVVI